MNMGKEMYEKLATISGLKVFACPEDKLEAQRKAWDDIDEYIREKTGKEMAWGTAKKYGKSIRAYIGIKGNKREVITIESWPDTTIVSKHKFQRVKDAEFFKHALLTL